MILIKKKLKGIRVYLVLDGCNCYFKCNIYFDCNLNFIVSYRLNPGKNGKTVTINLEWLSH